MHKPHEYASRELFLQSLDLLDIPTILCDTGGIIKHKSSMGKQMLPYPRAGASFRKTIRTALPPFKVIFDDPEHAPSVAIIGNAEFSYPIQTFRVMVEGEPLIVVLVCAFMRNTNTCVDFFLTLPSHSEHMAMLLSRNYEYAPHTPPMPLCSYFRRFPQVIKPVSLALAVVESYDQCSLSFDTIIKIIRTILGFVLRGAHSFEVTSELDPTKLNIYDYKKLVACGVTMLLANTPYTEYNTQPFDIIFDMKGKELTAQTFFSFKPHMLDAFKKAVAPHLAMSMFKHYKYDIECRQDGELGNIQLKISSDRIERVCASLRNYGDRLGKETALLDVIREIIDNTKP